MAKNIMVVLESFCFSYLFPRGYSYRSLRLSSRKTMAYSCTYLNYQFHYFLTNSIWENKHSSFKIALLCLILLSYFSMQHRVNRERILEMETWNDLANIYTSLSQWRDAEVCLSKSSSINPHSASRWYSLGKYTRKILLCSR